MDTAATPTVKRVPFFWNLAVLACRARGVATVRDLVFGDSLAPAPCGWPITTATSVLRGTSIITRQFTEKQGFKIAKYPRYSKAQ